MPKLMTLEEWSFHRYGENTHSVRTLRRWAKLGLIYPRPKKHGRRYFVPEGAEFVSHGDRPSSPATLQNRLVNETSRKRK